MSNYYKLPDAAVPLCICDLPSYFTTECQESGKNIRVCGRMECYDPENEILQLKEPRNSQNLRLEDSKVINTLLVDTSLIGGFDFNCRKNGLVICVGELQTWSDSRLAHLDSEENNSSGVHYSHCCREMGDGEIGLVLKSTICKPMDGLDYEKYCQYVKVVRQRNSMPP